MTLIDRGLNGVMTYQPLGGKEVYRQASKSMAAVYAVRCARISARLHWRPWPTVFTRALRLALQGARRDVYDEYYEGIYPETLPLRGDEDGSNDATIKEMAAQCVDGVAFFCAHLQRDYPTFNGAPEYLIARCWFTCRDSDNELCKLRDEALRHLIHIWRGDLTPVDTPTVRRVEAAGNRDRSIESARAEALR